MKKGFYQRLQSTLIATLTSAVVLAFLGPFGTYTEMTFLPRLGYWAALCFGIGMCMMLCVSFATRACAHPWYSMLPRVFIGAAIAGVPGVGIVIMMYAWMREPELVLTTARLLEIWGQVTLLGGLITLIELWRGGYITRGSVDRVIDVKLGKEVPVPTVSKVPSGQPITELHKLLSPAHAAADLISMSMQDHYVEITTTRGSEMVLMRFSDAIAKAKGVDGIRVHRSHWVATRFISDFHKSGRKAKVTLETGLQLPVSQTYVPKLLAILESLPSDRAAAATA